MARFLPPQASLVHLRNEAKALLKAHRQHQETAVAVLRHLHRFRDAADREILDAGVSLTDMQFALALDYGFAGWNDLRQTVLAGGRCEDRSPAAGADAVLLPNPPAGHGAGNRFAALYGMAFTYLGAPAADYATVLGDSGLAFILQADALLTPYGRKDTRQLDIGWWPNDPWGATLRLDFLRDVHGVTLRPLPLNLEEFTADPERHYRTYHEAAVIASLRAGDPIIAFGPDGHLVVGFDRETPPLLGQPGCVETAEIRRLDQYPWWVAVPEEADETLDRREADREALRFALRLGRDEVDLSRLPGKSGGARSWTLWTEQLADEACCGPHFYHANVLGNLRLNRRGAEAYLRAMAGRHADPVAAALRHAAGLYREVVTRLEPADTGKEALATAAGRQALIGCIRQAHAAETDALQALDEAVRRF